MHFFFYLILFVIFCVVGFSNTYSWWSDRKIWAQTLLYGFIGTGLILAFDLSGIL